MKTIRICLLVGATLLTSVLAAAPITSKQAVKVADKYMFSIRKQFPRDFEHEVLNLKQIYVVNYRWDKGPLGYVVVSGDDALPYPILAFDVQGNIQLENNTFKSILAEYCTEIKEWQEGKATDTTEELVYYTFKHNICPPLLKQIAWGQKEPYNGHMPLDEKGKRSLVGCTPIAMGQIMKYYQYPDRGTGENYYTYIDQNDKEVSARVNYDALRIDWEPIEKKVTSTSSKETSESICELLYYCAYSAEAKFSSEATSAVINNASNALLKHFGFHPSIRNISKKELTDSELQQLLYRELEAKRPVLCSGHRHAFVCDGFIDDFFHFNWGWEGNLNGFFKLSALKAGKDNFRMFNNIIVNLRPGTIKEELSKTVTLTEAGSLKQHLSDEEAQKLTSLRVIGKINTQDLRLMRKMAGATSSVWEQGGDLRTLDLSKAEIMSDTLHPYTTLNARTVKRTHTMRSKTSGQAPQTFRFETMTDKEWEQLCQLKGDRDYKNHSWKYVKEGDNYYVQYFMTDNKTVSPYLFSDCTNLAKLILPEQTQSIQQMAFNNCSCLQEIELPAKTTDVHPNAWRGCLSLKAVKAHTVNANFMDKDGVLYSKDATTLIYYPSYKTDSVYIMPSTVTQLRTYAFNQALFLQEIQLSDKVQTIPRNTFFNCPAIRTIRFPESVTSILESSFTRCQNLSKVYLPAKLEKMGENVFNNCKNLTEIYCSNPTPPKVEASTFKGLEQNSSIRLWVPVGTSGSYKQTSWSYFKNLSEL
ncbi:MAG TPA: C10 family peptidase [Bacteroides reticulotermitis]|nr:C10 family peptidase [Bacteroides reticulotermitis]